MGGKENAGPASAMRCFFPPLLFTFVFFVPLVADVSAPLYGVPPCHATGTGPAVGLKKFRIML